MKISRWLKKFSSRHNWQTIDDYRTESRVRTQNGHYIGVVAIKIRDSDYKCLEMIFSIEEAEKFIESINLSILDAKIKLVRNVL